ncbi:MAG: hypothetical protein ACRBF0_10960 [Calditrichia bacterium]
MKKLLTFILISALCLTGSVAADEPQVVKTDSLLIELRQSAIEAMAERNEKGLLETRAKLERLVTMSDQAWLIQHYIGWMDYNLVIIHFSKGEKDKAGKVLDRAIKQLDLSKQGNNKFAETHALLSGCYGMKIGLAPIKSMYYGPKSGSRINEAKKLAPNNPRVHLIDGIGKMNTPSLFGGGNKVARKSFRLADSLFSVYVSPAPTYPNWGSLEPKIWLAQIEMKEENLSAARGLLEEVLKADPENLWVKRGLMPELEELETLAAAEE